MELAPHPQTAPENGAAAKESFTLCLYVSGAAEHEDVIERAKSICAAADGALQVVDVLETPERARVEGIIATPTLVKRHPLPDRRVISDLADEDATRAVLGI